MVSGRLGWYGPTPDWRGAAAVIVFFLGPAIVWGVGIDELNRGERWSRAHHLRQRYRGGNIRAMRQSIRARLGWHFTREASQWRWGVQLRALLWFVGALVTAAVLSLLFKDRPI